MLIYTHSRESTPRTWSALSNNEPIDFQPISGNMTIRVTRRWNAATIDLNQIYDLELSCLYQLFGQIEWTRNPVLLLASMVCNAPWFGFLGFVIRSQAAIWNTLNVSTVVDALVSIQELTHYLSIQEMDFEFYDSRYPTSGREPIATGYVVLIVLFLQCYLVLNP